MLKKMALFIFSISIIFIILGVVFLYMENEEEQIDGLIVKDIKTYSYKKTSVNNGEMKVLKSIDYNKQGVFKISYKVLAENNSSGAFIKESTYLEIDDIYNDYFIILDDSVVINNETLKLENNKLSSKDGIKVEYLKNHLNIKIPNEMISKKFDFSVFLKLKKSDIDENYQITKEAYYSFVPSNLNSFYEKKEFQSYIIEGNGSISLKNNKTD